MEKTGEFQPQGNLIHVEISRKMHNQEAFSAAGGTSNPAGGFFCLFFCRSAKLMEFEGLSNLDVERGCEAARKELPRQWKAEFTEETVGKMPNDDKKRRVRKRRRK